MKNLIPAVPRVGNTMGLRIFFWLSFLVLFTVSISALCAPISNGDDVGCACADKRLRSGYLTRSMIESQNALAILKKIDAGDVVGAKLLASEIMKASKVEMTLLLNQETAKEEARSARKVIDSIDAYLDVRK